MTATQARSARQGAPAIPLPPLVACPGLSCLACGSPVGCQRLHRAAWAWPHLHPRPTGCPGLLIPAADLVYLVHLLPAYRHARHYLGRAASSGLLKVFRPADGAEFAELPWVDRMGPPGAPATPLATRHRLRVVGGCVPGAVVGTAVVLGTVGAGAVVVGTAAGAVVVGAGPDGDVVAVPGARVAGGIDLSPPATTTPTDVLPPCRGWVPTKLARGWLATASTPVIATTAIPKASAAATATRCQRIGWGCPSLAPSSLAPSSPLAASSLVPAWSPTRRTSERRATLWADASEWVYTASAGATSMLTSAAPMRVPSTPKKDATTAPLTAASAPASNLGMRSCSIPHLEVRVGTAAVPCGGHGRGRIRDPAAAWRAPTLATQAGSRQLPPGQEGDRAAWGSRSLGDRSFLAALVQRAVLEAAQGPGGPEVAHDPEHVGSPRVHESQRDCALSDSRAEILLIDQESCSSMRACGARWLSSGDNARAALSNALTNSRQIQHFAEHGHLPRRLREHATSDHAGARLLRVALAAGGDFELTRLWVGSRKLERQLKQHKAAPRLLCPACPTSHRIGGCG